jgi:uncharacterized protein YbjT (DUF2867 family)
MEASMESPAVSGDRLIVVTGATGLQGRAVTRHLLQAGWRVRALTRNAASQSARALTALGAQVAQGNMEDVDNLRHTLQGAYGVYSVQNPFIGGPAAEVRQGKNVADAAQVVGVQHLVYGSAGIGRPGTGVPSWETMASLQLPLTILRPMAFMELMTHPKFFPAAAIWHVMPALMGWSRPVAWLATEDLGAIAARVFAAPDAFVGQALSLASDVQSLAQCRAIYREVMGRNPARFPLPVWLFQRFGFVGKDLTTMWRWLRTDTIPLETDPARAIHPAALSVRDWLSRQREETRLGPR